MRRSFGPGLRDTLAKGGITHEKESRLGILHHGSELRGCLARIKRHHDGAFSHEREVKRSPTDRIRREKRAAIARLQAGTAQIAAHTLDLLQHLAPCQTDKLLAANFAKNDAAIRAFQLRENIFEKVGHEKSASRGERNRRRVIALGELDQIAAERRQILFPRKNAGTQRKFGVN